MKSRDLTASSLGYLWCNTGRRRIRKLLFFTYRFDFRWFHNHVLANIRKNSAPNAEVLVLATRFEDSSPGGQSGHYGDLYALEEWAKWGLNLRVRYLPSDRHLFHNKFILAEFEAPVGNGKSKIATGIGSANLTASGWSQNLELWSWNCNDSLSACLAFLKYLAKMPIVGRDALEPWTAGLKRYEGRQILLPWLFSDKSRARSAAFAALATGIKGAPAVLRVMSPYFDEKSKDVLSELLDSLDPREIPKIEIWIDRSGFVAKKIHLQSLIGLQQSQGGRLTIKTVQRGAQRGQPRVLERVHGKLIELEDDVGNVSRLLGSANFTGAAWLDNWNTETICQEVGRENLPSLLDEAAEVTQVSNSELERCILAMAESDDESAGNLECIYWAAIDESSSFPKLLISYKAASEPINIRIFAQFDPRRTDLPIRAQKIIEIFQNPLNWGEPEYSPNRIDMSLKVRSSVPERLRIVLHFADGRILESPVEVATPDFDLRDSVSGYPLDDAILENLLGERKTIVEPLPKREVLDLADEEIPDEDEELTPPPVAPETLVDDPEFDRQPQAVRFAKLLSKMEPEKNPAPLRILRKRANVWREQVSDLSQKVVIDALCLKLKDMPK